MRLFFVQHTSIWHNSKIKMDHPLSNGNHEDLDGNMIMFLTFSFRDRVVLLYILSILLQVLILILIYNHSRNDVV
jgi:hypothetical protein